MSSTHSIPNSAKDEINVPIALSAFRDKFKFQTFRMIIYIWHLWWTLHVHTTTSLWITSFTFSDHDLISLCHCQGHRGTCLIVIGQTESFIFLLSSYPIDCFVIEFKRCMVVMLHMHAERENYAHNAFCKFGMHSVLNSFDA